MLPLHLCSDITKVMYQYKIFLYKIQPGNYKLMDNLTKFKDGLQSVLRIGSAHNKGGPPNINIVQISHFSNSFSIETLVYIHL